MLIDRDKLLCLAKSERETCGKDYDFYGLLSDIEHAPTVDAVPVVHGRWICIGSDLYRCSACKFMFHGVCDDDNEDNYCRHCGAKMDMYGIESRRKDRIKLKEKDEENM